MPGGDDDGYRRRGKNKALHKVSRWSGKGRKRRQRLRGPWRPPDSDALRPTGPSTSVGNRCRAAVEESRCGSGRHREALKAVDSSVGLHVMSEGVQGEWRAVCIDELGRRWKETGCDGVNGQRGVLK